MGRGTVVYNCYIIILLFSAEYSKLTAFRGLLSLGRTYAKAPEISR